MLKKLIAHDFRCTWRLSILLLITSGVGAIFSMICGFIGFNINWDAMTESMSQLGTSGLELGQAFSAMLSYFAAFGIILMVAVHYYHKFVSDEAYLTFTLPATPGQHLLSKMVSGSVWVMVGAVAMVINTVIIQLPGMIESASRYEDEIIEDTATKIFTAAEVWSLIGGVVLMSLAFLIAELGLIYLCLTIGGVIANKNKAVAGGALYWFTNGFVSGVMTFVAFLVSAILIEPFDLQGLWPLSLMFYIWSVIVGGFGVAFYFINRRLLTTKLNLP